MRIASWNINSMRVRLPHVQRWLDDTQTDVLALQEIKMENNCFPVDVFSTRGFQISVSGQKTYNGVAIISRKPMADIETALPNFTDEQRRLLAVTIDGIRIINIYVPNGEAVDSPKYTYKLSWLTALNDYLQRQLAQYNKVLVLGDFNIAPHDDDVHDPARWRGKVLCSEPEREKFQDLLALGFKDSFRLFAQAPDSFSWWDYRTFAYRRNAGLRIDHILLNETLVKNCRECFIDKEPRGWEQPSDHAPVVVVLA